MAQRIGREYTRAQPKRRFRNLLDLSACVDIEPDRVVVTFDNRAHNPYLVASGLADQPTPMPWFGGKTRSGSPDRRRVSQFPHRENRG
jgi:hypothetical protein